MKTKPFKKIFLTLLILAIPCAIQSQELSTEKSTLSELAAEKISDIRNNPEKYVESTDIDLNILVRDFPWMQDKTGLVNKNIKASEDLIGEDQEAEVKIKTNTDLDEIEKEYFTCNSSILEGSVSGIITFNNYLKKEDALTIFINSLFKNESSLDYAEKRFILDCRFNIVKAEVRSVENDLADSIDGLNQYEIKLAFASDTDLCIAETVNVINFVRNNPWISITYIIDKHYPDSDENFYRYIRPIAENNLEPFFDNNFRKNKDEKVFTEAYGYFTPSDPIKYIERAVTTFMKHDLTGKNPEFFIFNKESKNIFLNIEKNSYNNLKEAFIVKYQITAFLPKTMVKENDVVEEPPVVGAYILFSQAKVDSGNNNSDSLYNPKEGVADKEIYLINTATGHKIKYLTDKAGRVQIWLEKNQTYILGYEKNQESIEDEIRTEEKAKYIKIDL
jgi:hypothetical protein